MPAIPSFTYFSQEKPHVDVAYEELASAEDGEKTPLSDVISENSSSPLISHHRRENQTKHSLILIVVSAISVLLFGFDVYLHLTPRYTPSFGIKTPVPEAPLRITPFVADPVWGELPNAASNERWMAEIGPSDGFLGVRNPQDYNNKPGIAGEGGENFGISMFHQLHCLILIRQAWHEARTENLNKTEARVNLKVTDGNLYWGHVVHCFDYLRQSIKCAGDMTLDWAKDPKSHKLDGMDGELHVCRDFEANRRFIDQNQALPRPGTL